MDKLYNNYNFETDYSELSTLYKFEEKILSSNKNKINFIVTHGNCSRWFHVGNHSKKMDE